MPLQRSARHEQEGCPEAGGASRRCGNQTDVDVVGVVQLAMMGGRVSSGVCRYLNNNVGAFTGSSGASAWFILHGQVVGQVRPVVI